MKLSELCSATHNGIVELHAVELAIYVPFFVPFFAQEPDASALQRLPVTDEDLVVLRFPSRYAALKALRETGISSVEVVHVSSYDEMIGLESTQGSNEMREHVVFNR